VPIELGGLTALGVLAGDYTRPLLSSN
jgi:hypothetical protein